VGETCSLFSMKLTSPKHDMCHLPLNSSSCPAFDRILLNVNDVSSQYLAAEHFLFFPQVEAKE